MNMSERACETVQAKGQRASNSCMDLRNQEEEDERETPAHAGCCQACQLLACVVVAMAIIILVMGLFLGLVLFGMPEAGEASEASEKELTEQLQLCQRRRHDVTLMLHTATQDSRCSLCPGGWLWWSGRCYFFSVGLQENLQWNDSAKFCRDHNSSLVVIKDSAEMEFIQGVMRRFPQFPFLWVGLTDVEQEGRWLWGDGTDVQHYMPVMVEWDTDHSDCADLRGGGSLFAASCDAYGPWACKSDS